MVLKKARSLHYLRFLYLVRTVKESMSTNVDPIEEQMLNLLGALWYEGKKVTVLEAMELLPEISSTTVVCEKCKLFKVFKRSGLTEESTVMQRPVFKTVTAK